MNLPYRSIRHSTQFFRRYYSGDAWTAEATFSKLPEKKWRERHFICFGFVSYRRCFLHSQPPFCAVGHFVCFSARLAAHYFAVYSVLGSKIKQTSTGDGSVSVRYNFLFISCCCLQKFTKQKREIGTSVLLI